MLDVIGVRRFVIVLILLLLNGALLFGVFGFFQGKLSRDEVSVRQVRAELLRYQRDLTGIKDDFDNLGSQQLLFDRLLARGFFDASLLDQEQDRFEEIAGEVGIEGRFVFSDIQEFSMDVVSKTGVGKDNLALKRRRVEMHLQALDDTDLYRYLERLNAVLPGILRTQNFSVQRRFAFDGPLLRAVIQGRFPEFLSAYIVGDWYVLDAPRAFDILDQGGDDVSEPVVSGQGGAG